MHRAVDGLPPAAAGGGGVHGSGDGSGSSVAAMAIGHRAGGDGSGASRPTEHSPYALLHRGQSRRVEAIPGEELPSVMARKTEAPPYEDLINFPRAKDKDEIRCVMCGLPPGEHCAIPRQNKDVCKECDKSTWQHVASSVYFKWCKGCKKFLRLGSFSEKLDAAKCDRCRERGRQSYLLKKGKDIHPSAPASSGPACCWSSPAPLPSPMAATASAAAAAATATTPAMPPRVPRARSASMTALSEQDMIADVEMTAAAAAAVVAVSRGIRSGVGSGGGGGGMGMSGCGSASGEGVNLGPSLHSESAAAISMSSSGEDDERDMAELSDCEEDCAPPRSRARRRSSSVPLVFEHPGHHDDDYCVSRAGEDAVLIDDDKADVTKSKLSSVFGVPLHNLATRRRRSLSCAGVDRVGGVGSSVVAAVANAAACDEGTAGAPAPPVDDMMVDDCRGSEARSGTVTPNEDSMSMRHRLRGTLYELACIHQRIVSLEERAARVQLLEDEIREQEGEIETLREASNRLREELVMSKLQQDLSRREADKLRQECSRLNERQQAYEKREAELTKRLSETGALEALASCVMEQVQKRPRLVSLDST